MICSAARMRLRGACALMIVAAAVTVTAAPGAAASTIAVSDPIVSAAAPPQGDGLWTVTRNGNVVARFDVADIGTLSGLALNAPVVGAASPGGSGLWVLGQDGGIFSLGHAQFFGSTGGLVLNSPVVGMAATPSGGGYWLVAADGGIFSFGDARFFGSTGAISLKSPVIGLASTETGRGYWLIAADGGVFAFGDASFFGSLGAVDGFAAAAVTPIDGGYAVAGRDGAVHRITATGFLDPLGPSTRGDHDFLVVTEGGVAVRWDPCQPVRYVTNMELAPEGASDLLGEAIEQIETATGIDLRFSGDVTGSIGLNGLPPPGADAVIAFSTPEQSGGLLNGLAIGVGGFAGIATEGGARATAGFVLVDSTVPLSRDFSPLTGLGTLLLHELGHMVGLDHVATRGELMFPSLGSASSFGAGDREGLWHLSVAQGCLGPALPSLASGPVAYRH